MKNKMTATEPSSTSSATATANEPSTANLMTRERWIEVGRIVFVGLITLLFWRTILPIQALLVAVAVGLYPLVKTGILDLIRERKIGTEIFVTVATSVAILGGEYVAGSVLMGIILIAEFIADLNTDRARASIKALIGSVPQTAIIKAQSGERSVALAELKAGDIVLVKAGEKIPVDGIIVSGEAAVNEAAITGESLPIDKQPGSDVLAGTLGSRPSEKIL